MGSADVPGWQQKKENLTQLEQELQTWKRTVDDLKAKKKNGTITKEEREQLSQLGQWLYDNESIVLEIGRSILLVGDPRQDMTLFIRPLLEKRRKPMLCIKICRVGSAV